MCVGNGDACVTRIGIPICECINERANANVFVKTPYDDVTIGDCRKRSGIYCVCTQTVLLKLTICRRRCNQTRIFCEAIFLDARVAINIYQFDSYVRWCSRVYIFVLSWKGKVGSLSPNY